MDEFGTDVEVSIIPDTADVFEVLLDGNVRGRRASAASRLCATERFVMPPPAAPCQRSSGHRSSARAASRMPLGASSRPPTAAQCSHAHTRVLGMAQLIHSKATMGHGKCGTAEEVLRIIDQTQAAIDSK